MKMKMILLLLAAACCARAQTDLPEAGTNHTEISSDGGYFDKNTRQLVYFNHVLVVDPKVKLWCERLTLDLPPEGRPTNVVAETNVVIDFIDEKGQTNHVTSDKAVYSFSVVAAVTNEIVTFTGQPGQPPAVTTADAMIYSEPLIWDRAANKFHFKDEKVVLKQSLTGGGTNASPFNFSK